MTQAIIATKSVSDLMSSIDEHVYNALKNSIYPGAADPSIAMVLAYCKAKNYDPLGKTCHIVPMQVKDAKTGNYEWRDVILPGISGYRIDAHRTGLYMGLSDPEFGPMISEKFGDKVVTYPEFCKITVKKMMSNGEIAEFSAKEYWKENYAKKGKDSNAPNAMWEKRSMGQLAKCAEAQALRKAFPEAVGNLPTFEEMEGKELKTVFEDKPLIESNSFIDNGQLSVLKDLMIGAESTEEGICDHLKIDCLESMLQKDFLEITRLLERKISKNKSKELPINKAIADAQLETIKKLINDPTFPKVEE